MAAEATVVSAHMYPPVDMRTWDAVIQSVERKSLHVSWLQVVRVTPPLHFTVHTPRDTFQVPCVVDPGLMYQASVLSTSIALRLPKLFLQYANTVAKLELYRLRAIQTPLLWSALSSKHFENFFRACQTQDQLFDVLGNLYYLLHRTRYMRVLLSAYDTTFKTESHITTSAEEWTSFMFDWPPPAWVKRKKIVIYPDIPHPVVHKNIHHMLTHHNPTHPTTNPTVKILISCLLSSILNSGRLFIPTHLTLPAVLTFMHSKVSKFMHTCLEEDYPPHLPCRPRPQPRGSSGCAFVVRPDTVTTRFLFASDGSPRRDLVLVSFPVRTDPETTTTTASRSGHTRQMSVVLNYEVKHGLWQNGRPAIFLRYHTDLSTRPALSAAVLSPKFRGRVPRLRFGNSVQSDGILVPWTQLVETPDLKVSQRHDDVSLGLGLRRHHPRSRTVPRGRRRRRRRRQPHPGTTSAEMAARVPFRLRCLLTYQDLRALAPVYRTLPVAYQRVFYLMFWELQAVVMTAWVSKPAICGAVDLLLRTLIASLDPTTILTRLNDASNIMLWVRFLPLVRAVSPLVRGFMRVMLCRGRFLQAVVDSRVDAEELATVVALLGDMGAVVESTQDVSPQEAAETFCRQDVPTALKRVLYHTMVICAALNVRGGVPPVRMPSVDDPREVKRVPRTKLTFVPPNDESVAVWVRRQDRAVDNNPMQLRAYIGSSRGAADAARFDLRMKDEVGRGEAVFAEALRLLWTQAVESGLFTRYTDHEFSMSVGVDSKFSDAAFVLGFVSSLCVARGLYLPLALAADMYAYLYFDPAFDVPYRLLFGSFDRLKANARRLPLAVRNQEFDISEADTALYGPDPLSNDDFVETLAIPHKHVLREFKAGWDVFTSREMQLEQVPPTTIASMFNTPTSTVHGLTYDGFVAVFRSSSDPRDEKFLQYVSTLSSTELARLVHFVTGNTRLPLTHIGEPAISIVWVNDSNARLPLAQNCTHTLLLPALSSCTIAEMMAPVFEFDTVFGFL